MDLGVALPTSGPHASPAAIVYLADAAERLDYAAVWTYERLLYPLADVPQPRGSPRPLPDHYRTTYEPVETLAFVAAKTTRVRLGISVMVAPFHMPVALARRLSTLDRFSEGRVIVGLGQGWIEQEFVTANVPLARRGSRTEEFIAAMRAAWGPDPVCFDGCFYRIPLSEINPKPVQAGGIPILLGGFAPAAVKRAARVADGLNPIAVSFEALEGMLTRFRGAARAAGRDADALRVVVRANVPITEAPLASPRPFCGGAPEQIAEDLARMSPLGVDHVFFANTLQPPLTDQVRLLERLQQAVSRRAI